MLKSAKSVREAVKWEYCDRFIGLKDVGEADLGGVEADVLGNREVLVHDMDVLTVEYVELEVLGEIGRAWGRE